MKRREKIFKKILDSNLSNEEKTELLNDLKKLFFILGNVSEKEMDDIERAVEMQIKRGE